MDLLNNFLRQPFENQFLQSRTSNHSLIIQDLDLSKHIPYASFILDFLEVRICLVL
jgi:hypothetical protein